MGASGNAIMCNLCGHESEESANYCGNCGVDLHKATTEIAKVKRSAKTKSLKKAIPPSKTDDQTDDPLRVIKWCWIKSLDPLCVLVLMAKLAKGESDFGFCDCPICNHGYREILVALKKTKDNQNLNATSPEIVQEALNTDFTKIRINLSTMITNSNVPNKEFCCNGPRRIDTTNNSNDKILVEIDKTILENAIVRMLESDVGKKIISEAVTPNKKRSRKEVRM